MWIVAKIKPKQYSIFADSITKSLKDKTEIYFPKIVVKNEKKKKLPTYQAHTYFVLIKTLLMKKS